LRVLGLIFGDWGVGCGVYSDGDRCEEPHGNEKKDCRVRNHLPAVRAESWGLGWGLGVWGLWFVVCGLWFRVWDFGFEVWGLRVRG